MKSPSNSNVLPIRSEVQVRSEGRGGESSAWLCLHSSIKSVNAFSDVLAISAGVGTLKS